MKVGLYDLSQTNDGEGIYINAILVDDKRSANNYWRGWDNWVELLSNGKVYDFRKRNEIIQEERKREK